MSGDIILDWHSVEFKRQVLDHLEANGEIAGEFIEGEARRRLLAISDPAWGRAYRTEIVSRLLTNYVERLANEVKILVGVKKGKQGSHIGFYIELGSATAPAHPFLRPAVIENAAEIIKLIEGK